MPLLELEPSNPPNTEITGEKSVMSKDSNQNPRLAPLLGTITSQVIEISRGSSERRSPESVCYEKLLRENDPSSPVTPQKITTSDASIIHRRQNQSREKLISFLVFDLGPFGCIPELHPSRVVLRPNCTN